MTAPLLSRLQTRLVLFALAATLPAFLLVFLAHQRNYRREYQEVERNTIALARLVSGEERAALTGARELLVALSLADAVIGLRTAAVDSLLAGVRRENPHYANIGLADAGGRVIASAVPFQKAVDISDRLYFRKAVETRSFAVGRYLMGRITRRPSLNVGQPVLDHSGRVRGVIYAALDLDTLSRLEAGVRDQLPPEATVRMVDADGVVLTRYPAARGSVGMPLPDLDRFRPLLERGHGVLELRHRDGEPFLHAAARVPQSWGTGDLLVLASIPSRVAFAEANRVLIEHLLTATVAFVLVALAAWLAGGVLVLRPLRRLLSATRAMGAGDFGVRVGPGYPSGEIGDLEREFDGMADSLMARARERDRAMHALELSEAEQGALIRNAPLGIVRSTADGRILAVNPRLVEMLGYESEASLMTARIPADVYAVPGDRDRALALFRRGQGEAGVEATLLRKDGARIQARIRGRIVQSGPGGAECFEMFVEDETGRRTMEEQLRRAQRMEALGQLAGGIAHDFNNLLTVISGYGQLLADRLEAHDPRHALLAEIQHAAARAAMLTRQLLAFSRKQVLEPRVLDLNETIAGLAGMLRRLLGEDVTLRTLPGGGVGQVRLDEGQLEQVIVNLVVNARDAMPAGGTITIQTSVVELPQATVREGVPVPAGAYVELSVRDTGHGMDRATVAHIFEPFFTTKEAGKGTGLGLATVYSIVKQGGGFIWVESQPGAGTQFTIHLPRTLEAPAEREVPAVPELPRGTATVLVVEDEAPLRDLVRRFLQELGYTVIEAVSPEEAIAIVDGKRGRIDLVLTDLVMPRMSGGELISRLVEMQPTLRVIYMSGHSDATVARRGVLSQGVVFLAKPFSRETLAQKVREAIGGGLGAHLPPGGGTGSPAPPAGERGRDPGPRPGVRPHPPGPAPESDRGHSS